MPIQYPDSGHIHPYPTGEDILDGSLPPCRVWVPDQTLLVLGYSQEAEREVKLNAVHQHNIPVYKRKGGGGAVLLSAGIVCIALRLRRKPGSGIADCFSAANGMIQSVLKDGLTIGLEPRGISDLAVEERKVLGASLYLPRDCAVYLASLLVNMDLTLLDRFLCHPSREPDYRKGRNHTEFVRNLNTLPGLENLTAGMAMKILEDRLSNPENPDLDWL